MTANNTNLHHFLWFSDIHYDPYYGTASAFTDEGRCTDSSLPSIGMHGCDSPKSLVKSALEHARQVVSVVSEENVPPPFVLLSGDSLRHGFDMLFLDKGMPLREEAGEYEQRVRPPSVEAMQAAGELLVELFSLVEEAFPDSEIVFSIGNNDVVPDYYLNLSEDEDNEGPPFLRKMPRTAGTDGPDGMLGFLYQALSVESVALAENKLQKAVLTDKDETTFLRGGYYSRSLHGGSLVILSLNTVIYSPYIHPDPSNSEDPGGQFSWMKSMLAESRNNNARVIIVGHIAPSVGSFRRNQLWSDRHIKTYFEIVREFDDVIAGQLFGHLHTDEFRVGTVESDGDSSMIPLLGTPILMGPGITPLHGNDPSFRIVKYGRNIGNETGSDGFKLLDYESHSCLLGSGSNWSKLYTFSDAYSAVSDSIQKEGLSGATFRNILTSMEDNKGEESPILKSFRDFLRSGADGNAMQTGANIDCDGKCRDEWMCTLRSATRSGYDRCLLGRSQYSLPVKFNDRAVVGIVGAALFVIVFAFFLMFRWRRSSKRLHYETTPSVGKDENSLEESSRIQIGMIT